MNSMKPSIILIRETEAQMTGSGCCGKLEGDNSQFCGNYIFEEKRKIKEEMGGIAQALHQQFGDGIEMVVVDPRNQLYLYPKILKDIWTYRPTLKSALKGIFMIISVPSIIINGEICYSKKLPTIGQIVGRVGELQKDRSKNALMFENVNT
ncbi:MAG: hypothetical protein ACE5HX_05715 [bacterium]